MTVKDQRQIRLLEAAALVRDLHLNRVAEAQRALSLNRARDAALDPAPVDCADPAVQSAALQHRVWAEGRRRALAPIIAAQEQAVVERRGVAARAFARYAVIEQMFIKSGR